MARLVALPRLLPRLVDCPRVVLVIAARAAARFLPLWLLPLLPLPLPRFPLRFAIPCPPPRLAAALPVTLICLLRARARCAPRALRVCRAACCLPRVTRAAAHVARLAACRTLPFTRAHCPLRCRCYRIAFALRVAVARCCPSRLKDRDDPISCRYCRVYRAR